jgi:hypothetical protein
MEKQFVKALNDMLNFYNKKVHSTIGMTPTQALKPENRLQVMLNSRYLEISRVKLRKNRNFRIFADGLSDEFETYRDDIYSDV